MEGIHRHFSTIAPTYRELRTTDLEPIFYIREELQKLPKIEAADFGCGAGRYALRLFQYLGDKLHLYCIDRNKEMLAHLEEYLIKHNIERFQTKQSLAEDLSVQAESLDCVFTFNAIHLFKSSQFLKEAARVLKDDGYLFIYTRLRSQNMRSIWGRYFPLFHQKETRLYELDQLIDMLGETQRLGIQNIEYFKYHRASYLDSLVEQARHHHYSTFHLYTAAEFEQSLNKFIQNLQEHFGKLDKISWLDENILFVVRKQAQPIAAVRFQNTNLKEVS